MKWLLIYIIVLSSLLLPKIESIDFSIFFMFLWLILYPKAIKIDGLIKYSLLSFMFVLTISAINYVGYSEIFGLLRVTNTILVFILTYLFLQCIDINKLYLVIIQVLLLSAGIILLEYLNIFNSRELITTINDIFYTTRDVNYRARGLYPGYASAGLMMGISSIILLIFGIRTKNSIHLFIVFILLLLTIITSRTGFLIAFIGMFFILLYLAFKKFSLLKFSLFILVSGIFLYLFFIFLGSIIDYDNLMITIKRFLELYDNYQKTGSASSTSTDALFQTYTVPHNTIKFLFGNNLQPWVIGGIESDVGFIQSWNQFGLIGMLAFYSPFLLLIVVKTKLVMKNKIMDFLIYSSIIFDLLIILSNFKGNYIYAKGVIFITLFLHILATKNYKIKRGFYNENITHR